MSTTTTTTTIKATISPSSPPCRFSLSSLPPFPSDVPTAPLLRLSLHKLLSQDPAEVSRFTTACEDLGFFYLDLSVPDDTSDHVSSGDAPGDAFLGTQILSQANQLFNLGEKLYDLPLEEKQKYDFMDKGSYFGYKGFGANVVDRSGRRDRNEFYNISKDDILNISPPWPAPSILSSTRPLQQSFIHSSHTIITHLLSLLSTYLHLPPSSSLPTFHRLSAPSGDQIRLIKSPPRSSPQSEHELSLGEHTDFGSVTLLFNRLGGLQVLPPGKDAQWCYVKPLEGHAIVNLGDAMVKFTNGRLRSNIHRVVEPPGEQRGCTRYSVVYFARPENGVLMKRLEGSGEGGMIPELEEGVVEEEITAEKWIIRRALGHRHAIHGSQAADFDKITGTEGVSRRDR